LIPKNKSIVLCMKNSSASNTIIKFIIIYSILFIFLAMLIIKEILPNSIWIEIYLQDLQETINNAPPNIQ